MIKTRNNYIPYLDGMRGLAIILVILAHIGLGSIVPGGFGVSLFFFISGFLITKLMIVEYESTNTISFKKFYLRRVFRLYPALVAMIILTIIIIFILHGRNAQIHPMAVWSSLFYFYNYYYVYLKPAALNSFDNLFNITWSLSIEEHFYLIFPVLFYWLYHKKDVLLRFLLALCVITFAYRFYLLYTSADVDATKKAIYVLTETRADSIIWGCISALLIYKNQNKYYLKLLQSNWALPLGVFIVLCSFLFGHTLFAEASRYTKQAMAFFVIVPCIGYFAPTSFVRKIFENQMLTYIGKISYSLYLFHWKAITLADYFYKENTFNWLLFVLLVTTMLALTSYYLIEQPFIALRKKYGSHAKAA